MITLIKQAPNPAEAKVALQENLWQVGDVKTMRGEADIDFSLIDHEGMGFQDGALYRLSETQAQAILELRLHRLTGLEKDKLFGEYREILEKIKELSFILSSTDRLLEVISDELKAVLAQYGDERRTEIIESQADLTAADLITEEDLVVTVSREGYVKAQSLTAYQAQRRGGRGKSATNVKDEDVIERLVIANSHDTILCFSSIGKVYWLKTYQLPQGSRNSRGKPIVNILPLTENERITSILPIKEFDQGKFVFMACASGMVKKVSLEAFSRPRSNGIIAVELPGDDQLIGVDITNGEREVMIFIDSGKSIRLHEQAVRPMGRTARGVRGVKLQAGQKAVSLIIVHDAIDILTATENGFGKRTDVEEYRVTGRGGQGVISIQVNERNGKVIGAVAVKAGFDMMLITNRGTLVRTRADEVSKVGRNTQGVRLIRLSEGERLISLEAFEDVVADEAIDDISSEEE